MKRIVPAAEWQEWNVPRITNRLVQDDGHRHWLGLALLSDWCVKLNKPDQGAQQLRWCQLFEGHTV